MKRILFVSLVAAALLVGAGCEKIIEFDGEQTQPRLTVSAQAEAGDSLLVYVASSIFFLTDQRGGDTFMDGLDTQRGQVRCFVNGSKTPVVLRLQPRGIFSSALCYLSEDYVPAPGDHIRLEAEFPGFDPVWAETVVPFTPAFEVVSASWRQMDKERDWQWVIEEGEVLYEVEIALAVTDDASYDKYYFMEPVLQYYDPYLGYTMQGKSFSTNDLLFRDMAGGNVMQMVTGEGGNYFSDALVRGQRREFRITVSLLPEKEEDTRLWIHGAAVNESTYWFDYSFSQLMFQFGGLFTEGVTLYSNVNGGYGAFCASASQWLEVAW